jgi:hypothetical protein
VGHRHYKPPVIEALTIAIQIVSVLFLVDFFSGVFHWLEDSYATEQTPILGRYVVTPNITHHHHPRDFVKSPFWHRNFLTALLCSLIFAGVSLVFGAPWQLWLFCILGAFCNEFHCWAHRSPEENGPFITALHRLRILQSPQHHAIHHTNPKNRAYCVLTNFTNPLLDRIEFWRHAESLVVFLFRVKPRPDASLKVRNA